MHTPWALSGIRSRGGRETNFFVILEEKKALYGYGGDELQS
jgi:hypothetical protein